MGRLWFLSCGIVLLLVSLPVDADGCADSNEPTTEYMDIKRVSPGAKVEITYDDRVQMPKAFCAQIGQKAEKGSLTVYRNDKNETVMVGTVPDLGNAPRDIKLSFVFVGTDDQILVKQVITEYAPTYFGWLAVGLTLILLVIFILTSGLHQKPIFTGPAGRLSVSKFQAILWMLTLLLVLVYESALSGMLLEVPNQTIALIMLFAGGNAVVAKSIAKSFSSHEVQVKQEWLVSDLVSDSEGVDPLRFQLLIFNLFAVVYLIVEVVSNHRVPELPTWLLTLIGASDLGYLGGKFADKRSESKAREVVDPEKIKQLQRALKIPVSSQLDVATRAAVTQFKLKHHIQPADGKITPEIIALIFESGRVSNPEDVGVPQPEQSRDQVTSEDEIRVLQERQGLVPTGIFDTETRNQLGGEIQRAYGFKNQ